MVPDAFFAVDNLRDRIRKQRLKLTQVATLIDVPYKSLHNYFSHKTEMPISVFIKLCEALNIPIYYPFYGLSPIEHSPLSRSIQRVLAPILPFTAIGPSLEISYSENQADNRAPQLKAGIITGLIAANYTLECETEFNILDDD